MPAVKKLMISTSLLLLLLSGLAPGMAGIALAPLYDRYADAVLGQPDFIAYQANNGGVSAQSLNKPGGIAIHLPSGRLYVADTFNNRVLSWPSAASFTNHAAADMVFGQGGSFITNTPNNGGSSAGSLDGPTGLAVDSNGNLYVADTDNHRILRFNNPPAGDTNADMVFGQGGVFNTNTANKGGVSANSLNWPGGLAVELEWQPFRRRQREQPRPEIQQSWYNRYDRRPGVRAGKLYHSHSGGYLRILA